MSGEINRESLYRVFKAQRDVVQFEESIRTLLSLNTQAAELSAQVSSLQSQTDDLNAQIELANQAISDILEALSGLKLDGLSDVSAASPADGNLLQFVAASNQWEPTDTVNANTVNAANVSGQIEDNTANVISSSTSLTDVSGSGTATHNNAPVSGDPAKYAVIDDNGTQYAIALYALP